MRIALLTLLFTFLLGAAIPAFESIGPGKLRLWYPRDGRLTLTARDVRITIAPAPCVADRNGDITEGCRYEASNNQAIVTLAAPGRAAFATTTNAQASYYHLGVFRLGRRDPRLGVLIVSDSGGSAGFVWAQVVIPERNGFRSVRLRARSGREELVEAYPDQRLPTDVSGDGRPDFIMRDGEFDTVFGCNACSPRPPLVLSVIDGRSVDLSALPAVRPVFARDMVAVRAFCRSGHADRNGNCAAYLADAARIGRFREAWRDMLAHYERASQSGLWHSCAAPPALRDSCPPGSLYQSFPQSVRAFLVHTGYITPAQAAAAPLS